MIRLTEEQTKLIALVVKGKTNQEIGKELNYSEGNVKKKLHPIFKIFGVKKRQELVREAMSIAYGEMI